MALKKRVKCLVRDCPNYNDGGVFIGDLCAPCYEVLAGTRQPPYLFEPSVDRIISSVTRPKKDEQSCQ